MPDFTIAPQTSVTAAVERERSQLDRIEGKIDRILEMLAERAARVPPVHEVR